VVKPKQIEAVYVGSESPPYAVNPSSTIIADILGVGEQYQAVDLQFACKAAAAGFQMAHGQVASGQINKALVIGTDKSQANRGDALEWSAGAAAAAFVVGASRGIATLESRTSISSDTPDFWRRDGQLTPSHGGRFTGEPGYFHHVGGVINALFKNYAYQACNFDHVVLHMPNGKFPQKMAADFGFNPTQLVAGFIVNEIGNPYAANALFALASVLDQAKPNQKILVVAYGSGAGADALVFQTTTEIKQRKKDEIQIRLTRRKQLSTAEYYRRF